MNLLFTYKRRVNHKDPLFDEFTYGDTKERARKLKELKKEDIIFFHTTIKGRKYITAYYVVDRVLDVEEAVNNRHIVAKFKNPHITDYLNGYRNVDDNVILFGDPITSKILERPLLFDRKLAEKLSLKIPFHENITETANISSATRSPRILTDQDINVLFSEIAHLEQQSYEIEEFLSTDEITELIEKDIETYIVNNSKLLGDSLVLKGRQVETRSGGRIDLLYEEENGNTVVVEIKLNKIGRKAMNQLRRYMKEVKEDLKTDVTGIMICKGVMSAFKDDFAKIKDVKIVCYGWRFGLYPWINTDYILME